MKCSIISFVRLRKWTSGDALVLIWSIEIFSLFGSKNKMKKVEKSIDKIWFKCYNNECKVERGKSLTEGGKLT